MKKLIHTGLILFLAVSAGAQSLVQQPLSTPPYNSESGNAYLQVCVQFPVTNQPLDGVKIDISALLTGFPPIAFKAFTGGNGCTGIVGPIPKSYDYYVKPRKFGTPKSGVTTHDLVLISRHISGTQLLDSPYKLIAADANKSGSISLFDIVEIRKLILGVYNEFPNNNTWRFVDQHYIFPDPLNPWSPPFPEYISGSGNLADTAHFEFYGIKTGDVDFSAVPTAAGEPEDRSLQYLGISDAAMQTGEMLEIPVYPAENSRWDGFQFSLQTDPAVLAIESVIPGDLPGMDAGVFAMPAPGLLNAIWIGGGTAALQANVPCSPCVCARRRTCN